MTRQEAIEWLEFMWKQEYAKGGLSPTLCNTAIALRVAIDVLEQPEIIRCKDCEYWNAGTCLNDNVSRQIEDCGCYPDFVTDSNWYCAEGKRGE